MSECVRWPFAYLQLLTTTSSTRVTMWCLSTPVPPLSCPINMGPMIWNSPSKSKIRDLIFFDHLSTPSQKWPDALASMLWGIGAMTAPFFFFFDQISSDCYSPRWYSPLWVPMSLHLACPHSSSTKQKSYRFHNLSRFSLTPILKNKFKS